MIDAPAPQRRDLGLPAEQSQECQSQDQSVGVADAARIARVVDLRERVEQCGDGGRHPWVDLGEANVEVGRRIRSWPKDFAILLTFSTIVLPAQPSNGIILCGVASWVVSWLDYKPHGLMGTDKPLNSTKVLIKYIIGFIYNE